MKRKNYPLYQSALRPAICMGIASLFSLSLMAQVPVEEKTQKVKIVKIINGEKTVIEEELPAGTDIAAFLRSNGIDEDIPQLAHGHKIEVQKRLSEEGDEAELDVDVRIFKGEAGDLELLENGKLPESIQKIIIENEGEITEQRIIEMNENTVILHDGENLQWKTDRQNQHKTVIRTKGENGEVIERVIIMEKGNCKPGERLHKIDHNGETEVIITEDETISLDGNGEKMKVIIHMDDEEIEDTGHRVIVRTEIVTAFITDLEPEDQAVFKSLPQAESADSDELSLDALQFYPNPNDGKFTLEFKNQDAGQPVNIKIMDVAGQTVFAQTVTDQSGFYKESIDLTAFPKGIYLLSLGQAQKQLVKKIVVQ